MNTWIGGRKPACSWSFIVPAVRMLPVYSIDSFRSPSWAAVQAESECVVLADCG